MQAMPERSTGWWISPAIPTIANCVLAALWVFSTAGGWAVSAFCGNAEERDGTCAADVAMAEGASVPLAVVAAFIAVTAWAVPAVRRRYDRLDGFLTVAALVWVAAEGVLFVGGYVAKP
ncbi:hypothetical protein ABZ801_24945 [Actinomadura sp. NPDC047616]|uniref:hypothetical protein n=1 Tax=Actinomadura sp. NPDC047616 TaxID=3155914 RepID=UPI00340D4012